MLILAKPNEAIVSPYSMGRLRKDNPNTSFPKVMSAARYAEWDVYDAPIDAEPVYDSATQRIEQAAPSGSGSTWSIGWNTISLTQQEIDDTLAAVNEAARIAELDNVVSTDTVVNNFKAMTNAEFNAWWTANVTNASDAIGVLKRVTRTMIRNL
tara:strand:- start:144 stop:605 length:462 start_codon:yes stop_codon:yes gene_type:complete